MRAAGLLPDEWQRSFLEAQHHRTLLCAARQSGKTQIVTAYALHQAITRPNSFVLILSPTLRQSGEAFREKLLPLWMAAGQPLKVSNPTALELRLSNGSRILSLPESEGGIRCFSGVTLLLIDEASRVADDLYKAVRPMLATRGGSLIALSTPFGQRGWFYEAWEEGEGWHKVKITADACPRLSPEFLADERLNLGTQWYQQEYECVFGSMAGALWDADYFGPSIWYDALPDGLSWAPPIPRGILSIDTSHGKKNSDAQAFVYCRYARDGDVYVESEAHRLDDQKLYEKAVKIIEDRRPSCVVVEVNEAGFVLFNQLKRYRLGGAPIHVLGRHHASNEPKHVRIRVRLTPYLSRGLLHFKRTAGNRLAVQEAQGFPLHERDDLIDALEQNLELAMELSLPLSLRTVKYEK